MFEHARGQFAVSLWDRDRRTLILGRDRVGICPLYYAAGRRLAALGLGGQGAAGLGAGRGAARPGGGRPLLPLLLRRHDADLLPRGSSRSRRGTSSRSGTAGSRCSSTGTSTSPTPAQERRLDDPTPLVDELEGLLGQAVERRLRGDVPVVSYISGGLDSTVVLGPGWRSVGPGRCRRSRSGWTGPGRTSVRRRRSRPRRWARR